MKKEKKVNMERALPGIQTIEKDDFSGYVKFSVKDRDDIVRLLGLQTRIWAFEVYEPTPPNQFHLTLLGACPQYLYDKVCEATGLNINYDRFKADLMDISRAQAPLHVNTIVVQGQSLAIFGDNKSPYIAMKVAKDPKLELLREPFELEFKNFLKRNGISDPDAFMESTEKLKWYLKKNWNPHITLGRMHYKPEEGLNWNDIDTSDIQVKLEVPQIYRGIETVIWAYKTDTEPDRIAARMNTLLLGSTEEGLAAG
jgi:hypothetical protein